MRSIGQIEADVNAGFNAELLESESRAVRKVVEFARKHNRVVLHGTQSRSFKQMNQAMRFIHEGGLGKVFLARGLSTAHDAAGSQQEEGIAAVQRVPLAEALAMCGDGRITDGETVAALALAAIRLGRLR